MRSLTANEYNGSNSKISIFFVNVIELFQKIFLNFRSKMLIFENFFDENLMIFRLMELI